MLSLFIERREVVEQDKKCVGDLGNVHLTFRIVVERSARIRRKAQLLMDRVFHAAQQVSTVLLWGVFPDQPPRRFGRIELADFAYKDVLLSLTILCQRSGGSPREEIPHLPTKINPLNWHNKLYSGIKK